MTKPAKLYRKKSNGRYEVATPDDLVSDAMVRFQDGEIEVEHWAIRVLAVSLTKSLGDSNYLSVDLKPINGAWLRVTLSRRGVLEPPKIKVNP